MFKVNEYKIVFKRVWHERATDINGVYVYGNGRYDTKCEIYVENKLMTTDKLGKVVWSKEPRFTGIARLHPNDTPDKIVGKKFALRNTLAKMYKYQGGEVQHVRKLERTAIWKAFWGWVASWPHQVAPKPIVQKPR